MTSVLREMANGTFHSLRAADLFPPQRWVVTGQKHQTGLGHRRLEDADQSRSLWPGVSTWVTHARKPSTRMHVHGCTGARDDTTQTKEAQRGEKKQNVTHTHTRHVRSAAEINRESSVRKDGSLASPLSPRMHWGLQQQQQQRAGSNVNVNGTSLRLLETL